jgi:hercynine metabolism protein
MSPAADWLEQLEARLEQQLEAFLRANPAQEALLQEQARLEHKQRQKQLLLQAEALRSELLQIAAEVHQWRERSERARSAAAVDLATQADEQVAQLMERGRLRWQALEQLGQEVRSQATTADKAAGTGTRKSNAMPRNADHETVDRSWARFEVEQELKALRQRQQRGC